LNKTIRQTISLKVKNDTFNGMEGVADSKFMNIRKRTHVGHITFTVVIVLSREGSSFFCPCTHGPSVDQSLSVFSFSRQALYRAASWDFLHANE
jgi:hypothetical protein